MSKNYTQFPSGFIPYETNRITCDFEDENHFLQAMEELKVYDQNHFYILQGAEGIKALDPTGVEHGFIAMLKRKLHRMLNAAEDQCMEDMVTDLEKGMIHLSVPAGYEADRDKIHQIMEKNGGQKIKYLGLFIVEEYHKVS